MRSIRFQIRSLLIVVIFAAVTFAALRGADDPWDSALFGVSLLFLTASILLAVHRMGDRRSFWLGFALFGWAYLGSTLVPPIEARLPTTKGLAFLDSKAPRATPAGAGLAFVDFDMDGQLDLFVADTPGRNVLYRNDGNSTFRGVTVASAANTNGNQLSGDVRLRSYLATWNPLAGPVGTSENFVRIGHSILTLVLAFLGGCLSRRLGQTGGRSESNDVIQGKTPGVSL